jgi:hypothetical protein
MPEGSLDASLANLQIALSAVGDVLGVVPEGEGGGSGLGTGLAGGAALAGTSPGAQIDEITASLSLQSEGLFSFDPQSVSGLTEVFGSLESLAGGDPGAALDGFSGLITQAGAAFDGEVVGQLQGALAAVRTISEGVPQDRTAIVATLLDQLLRIFSQLDGPEAQQINAWAQNLQQLHRTLMPLIEQVDSADDPAAAVIEVFQRALEAVLKAFGYSDIARLTTQLSSFADGALPAARLDGLSAAIDLAGDTMAGVQASVGGGFPAFRDQVVASADAMLALKHELRPVLRVLRQVTSAPVFQPNALENLLRERIEAALAVRVHEVRRIDDPFNALFDRIDEAVEGVDLSAVRDQMLGFFTRVRDTIEQVQIPSLGDRLEEQLGTVEATVTELEQGITGLLEQIQGHFDQLGGQLRGAAEGVGEFDPDGGFNYRFEDDLRGTLETALLAVGGDPDNPGAASVAGSLGELQTLLEQFIGQLDAVLRPVDDGMAGVAATAVGGIEDFVGFLEGLAIPDLMETLRTEVEAIVDALLPIDFALVVDPVVGAIDDTTEDLRGIDTEALNDMLREALKLALNVIVEIDFTVTISGPLSDQFAAVKALPEQALEQLQRRYEQALSLLDELQPQALLQALFSAFEVIREATDRLDLGPLLAPLDALHAQGLQQPLERLRPSLLLQPAVDAFGQAAAVLDGVDGASLIGPLDEQLQGLKERVAEVDVTAWIDELSAAIERVQQDLGEVRPSLLLQPLTDEFARLEIELDRFRPSLLFQPATELAAPLLALLEDAQQGLIDALFGMFQAPLALLDSLEPEALSGRIEAQIDALIAALRAVDAPARFNRLKGSYFDLNLSVEAEGVEARVALADQLDPQRQLGELMAVYNQSLAALEAVKQNIGLTDLSGLYDELRERLLAMLPPYARELLDPDTFKRIMRLADPTRFLDELDLRFDALKDRLIPIRPADIAVELDAVYDQVLGLVDGLDISASLGRVRASLERIQGLVDGIRVDFVAGDIDAALNDVRALIAALDPATLIAPLDTIHAEVAQVVADTRPSELLSALQGPLDQLQGLVDRVDPRVMLAPPLDEAWAEILALLAEIDFRIVLSPLVDKLDELEAEFIAGLDQTETAFDRMLGAAGSAMSGGSAGGGISVGGSI